MNITDTDAWIALLQMHKSDRVLLHGAAGEDLLTVADVEGFVRDVAHWKNNHATEVRRARVLKERTDLPIERVDAYGKWGQDIEMICRLSAENAALRASQAKTCAADVGQENIIAALRQERDALAATVESWHDKCQRLIDNAEWHLGGVLHEDSPVKDIPSKAGSLIKTRNLASVRDFLKPKNHSAILAARDAKVRAEALEDHADIVSEAMRRAWQLGQTYWQQADSESYSQNAKSSVTQEKFIALVKETRAGITAD